MNFKSVLLSAFLLISALSFGQIKIGTNPQNIDASSVLELESTSRALVLTRVNTTQMNAIIPLQGALVYNTESKCVHYYDGSRWLNICDALTNSVNISLTDNGDGTYTFSDATNKQTQINNLNESLLVEDGNLILRDSAGNAVSVALQDLNEYTFTTDAIINTFPTIFITQDADGSSFNFEVGIINGENIQDGSIKQADLAGSSVGSAQIRDNAIRNVAIADNAIGSSEIINGSIQPIDIGPGSNNQILTTDGAGAVQWTDQAGFVTAIDISYDNSSSSLIATDVQGALDEVAASNAADLDTDPANEFNTGIAFDGTILTVTDAGGDQTINISGVSTDDQNLIGATLNGTNQLQIDIENGTSANVSLASLEESADITTVQNNLDTHIAADGDLNDQNEIELPVGGTNGQILSTDGTGIYTWINDNGGTDQQNLTGATLDTSDLLTIDIENGTSTNVSLASLEESADITTVQNNLDTHIAADGDLNDQNEIELPVGGTNGQILSTDGTGIYTWINDNGGTDQQNLTGATLDTSDLLTIDIENGTSTNVSLASLEESADITTVQNNLDTHIAADGDLNDQNEIELPVGGTNGQILSTDGTGIYTWINDNGGTDQQNLTGATLDTSDLLTIDIENGTSTNVSLASLEESADITTVQNNLDTHIAADGDLNDQNEIELPVGGTNGQILSTDGTGIYTWINDNGGTDQQNLTGATLDTSDLLTIDIENGTSTNVSLASLEESADIATVQTNLDNHIVADGDLSSTNEIQTLTSSNGSITITPSLNDYDLSVTNRIVAMGRVSTSNNLQGATITDNSGGSYTVTLNNPIATADYIIQLTLGTGPGREIRVTAQTPNDFTIQITDSSGTAVDSSWYFTVTNF